MKTAPTYDWSKISGGHMMTKCDLASNKTEYYLCCNYCDNVREVAYDVRQSL